MRNTENSDDKIVDFISMSSQPPTPAPYNTRQDHANSPYKLNTLIIELTAELIKLLTEDSSSRWIPSKITVTVG